MKDCTTTPTTAQGNDSNRVLDGVKALANQMQEIENEKIECLAKFFDAYDSKIAKEIRDKGLPIHAFCGEKMYPVVKENMSHFFKVIPQPLCEDYQIILSWIKEPNPFDAWDGLNSI